MTTQHYNPDGLSPAQLWCLATSAILTERNGGRHDTLHSNGNQKDEIDALQHILKRDWSITSKKDLLDTLQWLETDGHNTGYMNLQQQLTTMSETEIAHYTDANQNNSKLHSSLILVKNYRRRLRKGGIRAWDDGRYISLCRWGATSGYITEDEAWSLMIPIGQQIQCSFKDWYSFGISYIAGRQYWRSQLSQEHAKTQMEYFYTLFHEQYSPWRVIAWNTELN